MSQARSELAFQLGDTVRSEFTGEFVVDSICRSTRASGRDLLHPKNEGPVRAEFCVLVKRKETAT